YHYEEGISVEQNYAQALQWYTKGCDQGEGLSCVSIGILYDEGRGVPRSVQQADHFFEKSCTNGDAGGCILLGLHYNYGLKRNSAVAKKYFGIACDLGDQKGCDLYKEIKQ
ncbi:MAG: sel1 repeat family protein, partial [Neisseriaceae bacterium]|nr:sel1 repeat family protein [Neisseriaceae bacterium]